MKHALVLLLVSRAAFAQPSGKTDAKSLMQTGVHLLEAKDYIGALAAFKEGYDKFPSAKFLLNMGTVQKLLDRKADAANSYQRYLDSPDSDAARKPEVVQALAELDKDVGKLELAIVPDDAQVTIGDETLPAKAHVWRVPPGSVTVQAKREGYQNNKQDAATTAGGTVRVALELGAIPKPEVKPVIITVPADTGVHAELEEEPRSRFGAFALVHVSVYPKMGGAPLIGATADVTPQLAVEGGFLFGPGLFSSNTMYTVAPPPKYGGYVGATFAFMDGQLRPRVSAGMPIFASNGARFSLRGAGGIEYVANRHLSMTLDLGAEIELNPETDIRHAALVPALGVVGRL